MNQQIARSLIATAITLLLCGQALAGGTASIGYSHLDLSDGVELGAAYGSVGYDFSLNEAVHFTPEIRMGTGVKDDSFFLGTVELDRLYGLAGRVSFRPTDRFELFASVSYVNYKFEFRGFSDSTWEPGFGAGAGFELTRNLGLELIYENVDSSNVGSAALRFRF